MHTVCHWPMLLRVVGVYSFIEFKVLLYKHATTVYLMIDGDLTVSSLKTVNRNCLLSDSGGHRCLSHSTRSSRGWMGQSTNCGTIFQSGSTQRHAQKQRIEVPVFLHFYQSRCCHFFCNTLGSW